MLDLHVVLKGYKVFSPSVFDCSWSLLVERLYIPQCDDVALHLF